MPTLKTINIITGSIAIGLNLFVMIPWTVNIFNTGGGNEGWGMIFLPMTFAFHLFIVTGAFAIVGKEKLDKKPYKPILILIWFLLSLLTLLNFFWINTLLMALIAIGFFSLIILTIHKKLPIERSVLSTNVIGSLGMLVLKLILNL